MREAEGSGGPRVLAEVLKEVQATQVTVFAGGLGKRMGVERPKALIEVGGRAMVDRCIDLFRGCGFSEFRFLLGFGHEEVAAHVKKTHPEIDARYSVDAEVGMGRGRSLIQALRAGTVDRTKRSVITFPDDVFTDQSLPLRMMMEHLHSVKTFGSMGSLVLTKGRRWPYGVVTVDDMGMVRRFEEKPFVAKPTSVGLYVFEPDVQRLALELSRGDRPFGVEETLIPSLATAGKLYGVFIPDETWYPVNTQKELEQVAEVLDRRVSRP